MIVCHCKGKTCRDVKAAALAGARSIQDVSKACEAGSDCGSCVSVIQALLAAQRAKHKDSANPRPSRAS